MVRSPPYASTYSRDARQFEEDQAITDAGRQELKWPPIFGPADAIAKVGCVGLERDSLRRICTRAKLVTFVAAAVQEC